MLTKDENSTLNTVLGGAPKVEVRSVTKIYSDSGRSVTALDDVSFTINQGEFFCLLGDSGCGKSTLLELIAGFERPTFGSVTVDGEVVARPSHKRGVAFQGNSLLPWLSARDNISIGLKIRGVGDSRSESISRIIDLMGLTGFDAHLPCQLSGGMAQRVAIARALVNDPDLLLLDEPFGALDSFTRKRLQSELVKIWMRKRFTAIFVTHDISEAVMLATRVVLMTPRPGRIAAVFNLHTLPHPRDSTSTEFFRMSSMITKEFLSLDRPSNEINSKNEVNDDESKE